MRIFEVEFGIGLSVCAVAVLQFEFVLQRNFVFIIINTKHAALIWAGFYSCSIVLVSFGKQFVSWVRLWGRAVLLAFSCLTSFGVAHVRLWLSPVGFVVRQFAWFVFNWCWYRFSIFVFVGLCCIICVSVNIYQAVVAGNVFGVVCTCLYNIPSTPFYDCIYKSVSVLSVVLLIWSMFGYIRIVLCFHYVIVCLLLFCFALLFAKSSLRVHSAVTRLNAHRLSWVWLKGMGKPGAGFPQCFFVLITIFIEGASKQNNRRTSLQQYCLLCELETTELLYESHLFRRKAASSQREPNPRFLPPPPTIPRPAPFPHSTHSPAMTVLEVRSILPCELKRASWRPWTNDRKQNGHYTFLNFLFVRFVTKKTSFQFTVLGPGSNPSLEIGKRLHTTELFFPNSIPSRSSPRKWTNIVAKHICMTNRLSSAGRNIV